MKEHYKNIGKTMYYVINGMKFAATINDVRKVWDRIDYQIYPAYEGINAGLTWVSVDSLSTH